MAKAGYVQLRRGLFEHVKDGRLSFFEASLYVAILSDANPATGVCFGSAGLYAALFGLTPRTCRDALEKLEEKSYLKRFAIQGKHGSYPILVNKFLCSDGAMKGRYVNADKSEDYAHICYESRHEDGDGGVDESVNEDVNESAASKRREKREQRQETKTLARSVPPEELAGTLPLANGTEFQVSKSDMDRWSEAFPGVNVRQELKKFKAWCEDNPGKKKTANGIKSAVFRWLDRAQNSGGANGRPDQKRNQGNADTEGGEDGLELYRALYGSTEQGKPH